MKKQLTNKEAEMILSELGLALMYSAPNTNPSMEIQVQEAIAMGMIALEKCPQIDVEKEIDKKMDEFMNMMMSKTDEEEPTSIWANDDSEDLFNEGF